MELFIEIVQIITAVLLSLLILIQSRASGLSATFGGGGETNVVQRRGAEKLLFKASIWMAVAFFALSVIRWYI